MAEHIEPFELGDTSELLQVAEEVHCARICRRVAHDRRTHPLLLTRRDNKSARRLRRIRRRHFRTYVSFDSDDTAMKRFYSRVTTTHFSALPTPLSLDIAKSRLSGSGISHGRT